MKFKQLQSKCCEMTQTNDEFKLRIVSVDHYMSKPIQGLDELYSEFNGIEITRVPLIRIFGVHEDGKL